MPEINSTSAGIDRDAECLPETQILATRLSMFADQNFRLWGQIEKLENIIIALFQSSTPWPPDDRALAPTSIEEISIFDRLETEASNSRRANDRLESLIERLSRL